jgi:mitotic spindle assembly checkpoint protein MAD2B
MAADGRHPMVASPQPSLVLNTFTGLIQTFTDFLIVSIHTILHLRNLLPPSTFIITRKYNYAVPQQRHLGACAWIIAVCSAIETQLFEGIVRRIIFVIYRDDVGMVERWMFDVDEFPVVPSDQASMIFSELSVSLVDIEEQLRATIQRMIACKAELAPLPQNCTYTVMVELKKMADPPLRVSSSRLCMAIIKESSANMKFF